MSGDDSTLSHLKVAKKINSTSTGAKNLSSAERSLKRNFFASSGQILSESTENFRTNNLIEAKNLIINSEVLFS